MYCSSCGVTVAQDLSYCKHCGAKLGGLNCDVAKSSGPSSTSLVWAMVSVLIIGLGAIVALMAVMKGADAFNEAMIKAFAVLSCLLMLATEGIFMRLLLRGNKGATKAVAARQLKEQAKVGFGTTAERMLPESAPSVTEHTTRILEPVYSERKSE